MPEAQATRRLGHAAKKGAPKEMVRGVGGGRHGGRRGVPAGRKGQCAGLRGSRADHLPTSRRRRRPSYPGGWDASFVAALAAEVDPLTAPASVEAQDFEAFEEALRRQALGLAAQLPRLPPGELSARPGPGPARHPAVSAHRRAGGQGGGRGQLRQGERVVGGPGRGGGRDAARQPIGALLSDRQTRADGRQDGRQSLTRRCSIWSWPGRNIPGCSRRRRSKSSFAVRCRSASGHSTTRGHVSSNGSCRVRQCRGGLLRGLVRRPHLTSAPGRAPSSAEGVEVGIALRHRMNRRARSQSGQMMLNRTDLVQQPERIQGPGQRPQTSFIAAGTASEASNRAHGFSGAW